MAKKSVGKKTFDLDKYKKDKGNKVENKTAMKSDEFFNCGEAFRDATGLPGPAMGHLNVLLGHSDTGKSTCMIDSAIDAQKKGVLPVFIITEKKWDFGHAAEMGLDATYDENTDEWDGFFLYRDDFEYIEQIAEYMNELLNDQKKGELPNSLAFFWDSIGSIPCKMTFEGKGGKMHNASALADLIGQGLVSRINSSRKTDYPYTNTLVVVGQPWVYTDQNNPMSQPTIEMKGGRSVYQNSTLVFLFGKQAKAGVSKIKATRNKRRIAFATLTKISVLKNHINALGYDDGSIVVTPHGFVKNDKVEIDKYKKQYGDYWAEILGGRDFNIVDEDNALNDEKEEKDGS